MTLPPPKYIDKQSSLQRWVAQLQHATVIAVDTEADSFHHYREKVCLIQMTAEGTDVIIDPLALDSLEPLRPIFADPTKIKIFHDAGFDLLGLNRDFGLSFDGLFDTMLASRLLGAQQFGLAAILQDRFDFTADKRFQRSDWAKRPLSEAQIAYARYDTHFLPQLVQQLSTELKSVKRLSWAREEFARLPSIAAQIAKRTGSCDADAWWRIKGVKALDPDERGRAKALYAERNSLAEQLDRPPFKVFSDVVILDLAKSPPTESSPLRPRPGLRRAGVERFGSRIVRAIGLATAVHGQPPPGAGRRRRAGRFLDPDARDRYQALRRLRGEKASEIGIDPEVLLGNATLEILAQDPPHTQQGLEAIDPLNGWRSDILIPALLTLLNKKQR